MFRNGRMRTQLSAFARNSMAVIAAAIVGVSIAAAQDLTPAIPRALEGTSAIVAPAAGGLPSIPGAANAKEISGQVSDLVGTGFARGGDFAEGQLVRPGRRQRITLEQVKQQSANRVAAPLAHLSELSIEAARQHRLGVQADYFPKFGATFMNLHATDFLGQVVRFNGPFLAGKLVSIEIINPNQTTAALTFVQPITPIFAVRQAVRIARADERIAKAKAAASIAKAARDTEVEEAYFKLLIAQRQLISAEWKLESTGPRPLYASTSADLVTHPNRIPGRWKSGRRLRPLQQL
jgi:hypothetical protein